MELIAREQCKTQVGTHKFVLTSSLQRSYFLFLQFMDGSTMILVSTSLNLNKKGSRNSISKKKIRTFQNYGLWHRTREKPF
jgi:hypothetical protein